MTYNRLLKCLAAAAALMAGVTPALAVTDGPGMSAVATDVQPSEEMAARLGYNLGYELFEKARAEEVVGEKLTGGKAKASAAKVQQLFTEARARFEDAAKANPGMKEAWNHIGYTSRRLGDYDKSLAAYEKALALNPKYTEAIEYRAEAYLALNRIGDAKEAYMTLFAESRPHAAVLMQSMQKWVGERRSKPAGVAATDVESFASWVDERAALAQQTASLATDRSVLRDWN